MVNRQKQTGMDFNEAEINNPCEYVQYAIDMERSLHGLQKKLAACTSPKGIAFTVMRTVADFYDAEWCGAIDVDMDLGVWSSYWWYSSEHGEMAAKRSKDLEMLDSYDRWVSSMQTHEPMVMTDVEEIKDSHPEEYEAYQRLDVHALIAVPFWMHSTGFFALKNPRKYKTQTGLIRLLSYAIVTSLNEHRLTESTKLSVTSPRISSDTDVYISLFGELKITTSKGILRESELKSPKISKMLVYLLLSRKSAVTPREVADAVWPDEDTDVPGKNMKSLVYRLQQAFSLISEYRLIESTPIGYQLNTNLNIITDMQLFENKWSMALKATANEDKEELLKKLLDLYEGDLLHSASSEHWLMPTSLNFQYRYIGAVNELMKVLWEEEHYHHIHSYAAHALAIVPHNPDVHFWLIRSMCKQGHTEIARGEIRMAENRLLEEEYALLMKRLAEDCECTSELFPNPNHI